MKKVLLALLPAFMLCSCAGNPLQFVEDAIEENAWANVIEDDDAHDEIFSKAPISFGDKKNTYSGTTNIGVQYAVGGSSTSIRFVAAVNLGEGDLASTTAVWTRGAYYGDTGYHAKAKATKESTKAYTSLYDGSGELYTIATYNTEHETNYTHFVVYTLLNIPTTSDWERAIFVTAYVTIDGAVNSKAVATTVDGTTSFSYDASKFASTNNYFGVQKSGTSFTTITPTQEDFAGTGGKNYATFTGLDFAEGDGFVYVRYSHDDDNFHVYNWVADDAFYTLTTQDSSLFKYAELSATGSLYVSCGSGHENQLYTGLFHTTSGKVYLKLTNTQWEDAGARFAVVYVNTSGVQTWADLAADGEHRYSATITRNAMQYMIFCRMNPATAVNNWDNKWDQTSNIYLLEDYNGYDVTSSVWSGDIGSYILVA